VVLQDVVVDARAGWFAHVRKPVDDCRHLVNLHEASLTPSHCSGSNTPSTSSMVSGSVARSLAGQRVPLDVLIVLSPLSRRLRDGTTGAAGIA
jgi:hypothetical protein